MRIQKVILIVEQDVALRDTISDSLRGEGYHVHTVTGEAGVEDVARNIPITIYFLKLDSILQGQ